MPQQAAIDKFFGAVDDAYDTILDTLKAGVDRGHRVSRGLLEQAQEGQHEALELAQTVAKSPTDFGTTTTALVQTLTNTQARVLELSRQWLDEAIDAQQEGRDALRRLIDANRQAGEAVIDSSRGALGQAQDRARQVVRRRGPDGAKAPRAPRSRRKAQSENAETS